MAMLRETRARVIPHDAGGVATFGILPGLRFAPDTCFGAGNPFRIITVNNGAFRQNQIHVQGTYYFYNGDRYVGPWLRGEPDGPGIYYDAKGNSKQMEFRGGRRVT